MGTLRAGHPVCHSCGANGAQPTRSGDATAKLRLQRAYSGIERVFVFAIVPADATHAVGDQSVDGSVSAGHVGSTRENASADLNADEAHAGHADARHVRIAPAQGQHSPGTSRFQRGCRTDAGRVRGIAVPLDSIATLVALYHGLSSAIYLSVQVRDLHSVQKE